MSTGISIYLGTSKEKNEMILKKAKAAQMSYVFTSLHISEEQIADYRCCVKQLLTSCQMYNLTLIADISPKTLDYLQCQAYEDLADLGLQYLRLDDGFSNEEVMKLSQIFHLVFNASTITDEAIKVWKNSGVDFSRFLACHNFYPKPLTGLSLKKVKAINEKLKALGFRTAAFVAGDQEYRGPIHQGLPTVEEHRSQNVFLSLLELFNEAKSDLVLIGDIDVSPATWQRIDEYNKGFITLRTTVKPDYEFLKNKVHHDRLDSSDYVIRSQESRADLQGYHPIIKEDTKARKKGAICVSNELYLRYQGEIEIARLALKADERVNVIGYVQEIDQVYLPHIKNGFGFVLK